MSKKTKLRKLKRLKRAGAALSARIARFAPAEKPMTPTRPGSIPYFDASRRRMPIVRWTSHSAGSF